MRPIQIMLSFTLLFSAQVFAQATCAGLGETPLTGTSCCEGLKLNSTTNLCADPVQDAKLISCSLDSDCGAAKPGQGLGCFRMTEDDFYSEDVNRADQFISRSDSQDTVDDDRDKYAKFDPNNEDLDGLPDGSACKTSSECDSYSCDPTAKKCTEKKICRLGDMGEAVGAGVRCEKGLIISSEGKCDLSDADKELYYMGLIEGDVTVKTQNKCDLREYQNDPQMADIRSKSMVSMKTLRAMEWLFATSSLDDSQECLMVLPFMRDQIAKVFNDERKKILTNFNIEMAKIEFDSNLLKTASDKSTATIMIHGETIKEKDLATRRTSGYDAMKLMWRRNLLFQSYETAMKEIITAAGAKLGTLPTDMGNWKDKGKKWTVNGKEWSYKTAGKCRGKKAKKIKKRWANFYQVNATTEANSAVVKSKTIADYLSLVSGDSADSMTNLLINGPKNTRLSNYFLIDPLMPGDKDSVKFETFGSGKSNKRRLNDDGYAQMRKVFRERIQEFYKRMKGSGAPEGFVYEPELIKMEARDCIEKPNGPSCDLYKDFLDEMTDIAFAQFLAYSVHSQDSYKRFFSQANMRRKLLAKYATDMQNVVKYYDAMSTARTEQTKCLETSMNHVVTDLIDDGAGVELDKPAAPTDSTATAAAAASVTSGSGSSSGSGSGAINNSSGENSSTTLANGTGSKSTLRVTTTTRVPFTGNLRTGTFTNKVQSAMMSNMGAGSSSNNVAAGTNIGNAANTQQFATRLVTMRNVNAGAKLKGVNLPEKEKAIMPALKNLSASSAGASSSSSGSKVASSNSGGTAAALEIVPKNTAKNEEIDLQRKIIEAGLANGTAAKNADSAAATSGFTESAQAASSVKPAITDTDQEIIEANYERSKGEYSSDEEDPLFSKVSKAYVRNLDKILTKKKKIEE